MPQEVLPRSDTRGDVERDFALVRNQFIDGPRLGSCVVAVFVDLEPF